jgi:putative DNA primase/helicase
MAKFWLAVNHLPRVRDDSHGFWRRVRVLPFTRRFSDKDADQDLTSTLLKELPGILSWAVRGALSWQSVGLAPPDTVVVATEAYREESDELTDFIADRCILAEGAQAQPGQLYSEYQTWAKDQGILERSRLSIRAFGYRINDRYGKAVRSNGKRQYHGIGLRSTQ